MVPLLVILSLVELMDMLTSDAVLHPAVIRAQTTKVKEGDGVTLQCSISDTKTLEYPLTMYLCKDGVGLHMKVLIGEKITSFSVDNFTVMDSGNYSCVYSTEKMLISEVNSTGFNSILIQLHRVHTVHPANIFAEKTSIIEGEILQLKCEITDSEHHGDLAFHLCKNGVGILVTPVRNNSHAVFSIRNITTEESGNYSCVFAEEHMLMEVRGEGVNSIHITVSSMADVNGKGCGLSPCYPAHILPAKRAVLIGEPIQINCSIEDPAHKSDSFNMYLCKDGVGVQMIPLKDQKYFTVETPSSESSGYYNCVYSTDKITRPKCGSKQVVYLSVYDPNQSGGIATVTVIFILILTALLVYQHRARLKSLICADRGQHRQGTPADITGAGTGQQNPGLATKEEVAEYATISDSADQHRVAVNSSAINTVYSVVQNEDGTAGPSLYSKVTHVGKTKKHKGGAELYSLAGHT